MSTGTLGDNKRLYRLTTLLYKAQERTNIFSIVLVVVEGRESSMLLVSIIVLSRLQRKDAIMHTHDHGKPP